MTYIVYFGLLFCCFIFAWEAERSDKKMYILIIAALLSVVSGLRADTVGIDTVNYIEKFQRIAEGNPQYAYGLEEGFKFVCGLVLKVWNDPHVILVLMATLTNFLILTRMWDFRDIASVPCMVLCYYCQFYFITMNVVRQFLAIAILFYATRYLQEKKYPKFTIIVILTAVFCHRSALVGFLFLAVEVFKSKNMKFSQIAFLALGFVAFAIAVLAVADVSIEKYLKYFKTIDFEIGFMVLAKILFFAFIFMQQREFKIKFDQKLSPAEEAKKYRVSTVNVYYMMGLMLALLGYCFDFMDRIGWYFYIFEGCSLGILLKNDNRRWRQIAIVCIALLQIYSFADSIIRNSQGVVPYVFLWSMN